MKSIPVTIYLSDVEVQAIQKAAKDADTRYNREIEYTIIKKILLHPGMLLQVSEAVRKMQEVIPS